MDLVNLFKSIVPQCSTPTFLPHNSMSYTILKKRLGNRLAKRCGPQTRVAAISTGNPLSKLQTKTPNIYAAFYDHATVTQPETPHNLSSLVCAISFDTRQTTTAQASKHSYRLTLAAVATRMLDEKDSKAIPNQNRLAVDNSRQTRELRCQSHATSKKVPSRQVCGPQNSLNRTNAGSSYLPATAVQHIYLTSHTWKVTVAMIKDWPAQQHTDKDQPHRSRNTSWASTMCACCTAST